MENKDDSLFVPKQYHIIEPKDVQKLGIIFNSVGRAALDTHDTFLLLVAEELYKILENID